MEQMPVDPALKIDIDYDHWPLTSATQQLQPVVFRDSEVFCCLLGPDLKTGIVGRGDTPYQAVTAWEQNLHDRLAGSTADDDIATFVRNTLNIDAQIYGSAGEN